MPIRIAVLWHSLGPYHAARLRALAKRMEVTAVALSGKSVFYAWEAGPEAHEFRRVTLFPEHDSATLSQGQTVPRVQKALYDARPEVIAIPSWGHPEMLAALLWGLRSGTPCVVMTDSNQYDKRRWFVIEAVKRRIIRLFQAGLVPSKKERSYLEVLGMVRERVFEGYDVVDNEHFRKGAERARAQAAELRASLGLPAAYFLAAARYIEKKNLLRLLAAYARYRELAGPQAWSLVMLGDGPQRPQLERTCSAAGFGNAVLLTGFKQYEEMPSYYGLANALVLASISEQWGLVVNEAMACGLPVLVSKRCGCATTLVQDRVNGYTFDPLDIEGLARLMHKLSSGAADLAALGEAGRQIISHWTPDTFAENLLKASECALAQPKVRASFLDRLVLKALTQVRPKPDRMV
jgi:glycosyltransferase involved in cell wall biosynthesis